MQTEVAMKQAFRVWGTMAAEVFDKLFPSVECWRAWRRLNERRYPIEVFGMKSEAA
ncbi:hypothetical protein FHT93_005361 [Rhizobium sp. BK379]|nr:hypothetical protein [Rhizobium sp. BK379]